MNKNIEKENYNGYIVGIGASAGGLEAIQKLLSSLPSNTGFPYIIVQHLSPDYKSLLSEILSKYTDMPVIQVEDGMIIEPDCVYVIQPGKNMRISGGKIVLSLQKERELNLPIDLFFHSLAEEAGPKAIAIVLSGTGSDGTNGIRAIKENDGMILVQDLDTAKFDGMPRSAMRTGLVDAQISPETIALELIHIANSVNQKQKVALKTERQIDEELMKKIYYILRKVCNINFTHYKQTTILRRIERRMMLTHKELLSDYVSFLYDSPEEVRTLSKEVLIGVTSFFRDPDFFQILKDKAIQEIVLHSNADEGIRVWVAGCSTGEEAYSIAILFSEVMEKLKIKRNVKIFATDLDVESITVAGKGVYGDSIIESVSTARLSKYFTRQNNSYIVNRDIRKMIVFSPHNVFQDPPFGRLDLISCRNMLIYFQPVLQNDLFAIFHSSLKNGGYLFLGKSEAIGAFTEAYPIVDAAAKIFTHQSDIKISGFKNLPYLQTTYLEDDFSNEIDTRFTHRTSQNELGIQESDIIDMSLLEQFMPACLVINDKNEIVHTFGDTNNYIHISVGKFSNILFDVIVDGLKIPASTLLKESREKNQKVQYKNICFTGERVVDTINMTVLPIKNKNLDITNLYAIIFSAVSSKGEMTEAIPYDIDIISSQRITDLEQELGSIQGKLDRSIAEQECVNEELQAANEELLTANEELQSSNEELQSVNEELYTVNSEYQQKLTELADLNDDIANFLSSTLIGIIFVDNKLNIRRYTDYVTTEFSVMDHDIGRSLKFISYHFPTIDISEICDNVLKTLVPDEREVMTGKKKVFLMRVAPYRSTENKILGCVITLVDVSTQKQGLAKLQNTEKKLSLVQQDSEAKSDYLSRIVHEIRSPMGTLVGLIKIMKNQIDDKEALLNNLENISNTIDYMASLVTDISDASESERARKNQILEPFDLKDVLNNVDSIIRRRAEDSGLVYELSIPDDFDTQYLGNKTAVQQIIINFLNNSIKYTPKGGAITLKISEDNDKLCLTISDTGKGISKEFLPEIFKPFTREDSGDKYETSSMGLGLSIAYNLIKSLDGEVFVESEVDKGTTFTIYLSLEKNNKNSSVEHTSVNKEKKINVLVADDNELNRMILCTILKKEGITCEEACDGEEAFNKFFSNPEYTFDCILMDMRMPNIDGIKATAMIRDSIKKDALSIPIIGVSANGFADDIRQARESGLNSYTTKPIDPEKLFTIMYGLINKNK